MFLSISIGYAKTILFHFSIIQAYCHHGYRLLGFYFIFRVRQLFTFTYVFNFNFNLFLFVWYVLLTCQFLSTSQNFSHHIKTCNGTNLYSLSSVLEIWARHSRSWPFMRSVTIGTPCSITVRTGVAPTASWETTRPCRLVASSNDMLSSCEDWLDTITARAALCGVVQNVGLNAIALSLAEKTRCGHRRWDKFRRLLVASLLLPRQPSPHHRLVSQWAASRHFSMHAAKAGAVEIRQRCNSYNYG